MDDLPIKDKELFLRYAIPCGGVLVDRGSVSQKTMDQLKGDLLSGRPIGQDLGKIFQVGVRMLNLLAYRRGKTAIDQNTIRRYFWFEHPDCVREQAKTHPDVVPEQCIVLPARVLKAGKETLVRTPLDDRKVKQDFVPDIKPGEWVMVHYSYIVERITEKQAKWLKKYMEREGKLNK